MAPYQLPHLENPQPPAPGRACGNWQRDQPSTSSVRDTATSPLWQPCPSLPEAPAEDEPAGWMQAAAHAASTGQAGLLSAPGVTATRVPCKAVQEQPSAPSPPDSSSSAPQNLRVALQSSPSPKCSRQAALPVSPQPHSLLLSSHSPSCSQQAGLGKPLLGDSLPSRQKCFLGYTQLGTGKRRKASDPS